MEDHHIFWVKTDGGVIQETGFNPHNTGMSFWHKGCAGKSRIRCQLWARDKYRDFATEDFLNKLGFGSRGKGMGGCEVSENYTIWFSLDQGVVSEKKLHQHTEGATLWHNVLDRCVYIRFWDPYGEKVFSDSEFLDLLGIRMERNPVETPQSELQTPSPSNTSFPEMLNELRNELKCEVNKCRRLISDENRSFSSRMDGLEQRLNELELQMSEEEEPLECPRPVNHKSDVWMEIRDKDSGDTLVNLNNLSMVRKSKETITFSFKQGPSSFIQHLDEQAVGGFYNNLKGALGFPKESHETS